MIKNEPNPRFQKTVQTPYVFERFCPITVAIYDADAKDLHDLSKHDFIGSVTCQLAELLTARSGTLTLRLRGPKCWSGATVTLLGESVGTGANTLVTVAFSAEGLDIKDKLARSSDPYLKIWKSTEAGVWTFVHETPVIKRCLNPAWPSFTLPLSTLCNSDRDRPLKIECFAGTVSLLMTFN
jgi:hypothetical protein